MTDYPNSARLTHLNPSVTSRFQPLSFTFGIGKPEFCSKLTRPNDIRFSNVARVKIARWRRTDDSANSFVPARAISGIL